MLSSISGSMGAASDGTKIEVTVQSLQGVMLGNHMLPLPEVTATVSFSGSAADMEVCSSTLCSLTGRLMIEAEPICINRYTSDSYRSPLTVEWSQKTLDKKGFSPHLTCQLPFRDPDLPKFPLSRSNRGSQIVKEFPSLDDSDTQSTATDGTESTCGSTPRRRHGLPVEQTAISPARSSSAVWSGAAMPEIIELTTRFKVQGEEFTGSQKGVAFLVLFGHNDRGTYICDLPVRQSKESYQQKTSYHVYLSEEARLRVKVKVTPQRRRPMVTDLVPSSSSSTSSQSGRGRGREIVVSRSVLEEHIAPLVERIRKNEELAMEHRQKQKRAMDVHVPLQNGGPIEEENSLFCSGSWTWNTVLQTLTSAMANCDGGSVVGVALSGSSDASTIATGETWWDV
jgi:hypothetical protein